MCLAALDRELPCSPSCGFPQNKLLGLADDPGVDPVSRTAALDMDVLYLADETHQVEAPAHPIACVTSGQYASRVPSLTLLNFLRVRRT
jgi:hypothetical protein